MSASIQDILREHRDMPNSQVITHYHENIKRIDRIEQLERELAEAKDEIRAWGDKCKADSLSRSDEVSTYQTKLDVSRKIQAAQYAELSAIKERIKNGELISPQTIHDFLDTKHDRWNPLFMRDLVRFAAERAKEQP